MSGHRNNADSVEGVGPFCRTRRVVRKNAFPPVHHPTPNSRSNGFDSIVWKEGRRIKIVPLEDGVERFLEILNSSFSRIPQDHQDSILNYLESSKTQTPMIEWSNFVRDPNIACYHDGGRTLKFRQNELIHYPDNAFGWVIAHEFAHVFQKTIGRIAGGENETQNEKEADRIAKSWGFCCFCARTIYRLQIKSKMTVAAACAKAISLDLDQNFQ